jgi:hypothetical protein
LRRATNVAGVVFGLLVIATIAAFAWSQQLKRDPLVLDRVTFRAVNTQGAKTLMFPARALTPNGDCRFDRMRIRFRVTRSDRATVQVIAPGGKLIITLARDHYLKRYRFFTFYWNGRSRLDGAAPPGRYKLRVKLHDQDRVLVPPGAIRIHRALPRPLPGCEPEVPR